VAYVELIPLTVLHNAIVFHIYQLSMKLIPYNVLLEKLTVPQVDKKFPALYENPKVH
jgi:hypothetical protein